jgi:hypothetical protein
LKPKIRVIKRDQKRTPDAPKAEPKPEPSTPIKQLVKCTDAAEDAARKILLDGFQFSFHAP